MVTITQNTISGHEGDGIETSECVNGVDIVCNIITDNGHGIYVAGDWNNILRNEISNNVGIADSGIHLTSGAEENEIHYNNISGNSGQLDGGVYSYGVFKEGGKPVDATNNYWGAADGPGGSGPGSGDWVNDLVTYDPFLTASAASCFEGEDVPPVIDKAEASPSMISIWHDDMFWDMWGDANTYSVGPSCFSVFYVVAHDDDSGVASVTMNWKDLLIDYTEDPGPQVVDGLIPEDKLEKFLDEMKAELPPGQLDPALDDWQSRLAELEAVPMKHKTQQADPYKNVPGIDCWYFDQTCLCDPLFHTITFFDHWLEWDEEFFVIVAEIMGQELNLGDFEIEVTVTDFKGNYTFGYIPITIVDYQMPVCEGWNLRSTWLTLENNKWQNIVPTMHDPLNVDSILRWNSQYQRWEYYAEVAGIGYWYYGITQVATALMQPLESYSIHSLYNDQFGLITYRGVSAPPARQMYAGWNLIGADIPWQGEHLLPPGLALISAYEGEEHCTGYTQVLSVDQYNYWYEELWVCGTWLWESEFYEKWFEQDTWVFIRDEFVPGEGCYEWCMDECSGFPPCVLDCYEECSGWMTWETGKFMTQGGGYWVFMANPAVLGGFNSTPLPMGFWEYWWSD